MATDPYQNFVKTITQPGISFAAVTPSDSATVSVTRGLYVGITGDVAVKDQLGNGPTTFTAVPAGTLLPIRVSQVMSTGTTATNIVAIY